MPAKNVRIPSSGTYSGVKFQPGKNIGTGTMEVPVINQQNLEPIFKVILLLQQVAQVVQGLTSPTSKSGIQKAAE